MAGSAPEPFDSFVMLGNNLGLLGAPDQAPRFLDALARGAPGRPHRRRDAQPPRHERSRSSALPRGESTSRPPRAPTAPARPAPPAGHAMVGVRTCSARPRSSSRFWPDPLGADRGPPRHGHAGTRGIVAAGPVDGRAGAAELSVASLEAIGQRRLERVTQPAIADTSRDRGSRDYGRPGASPPIKRRGVPDGRSAGHVRRSQSRVKVPQHSVIAGPPRLRLDPVGVALTAPSPARSSTTCSRWRWRGPPSGRRLPCCRSPHVPTSSHCRR